MGHDTRQLIFHAFGGADVCGVRSTCFYLPTAAPMLLPPFGIVL